MCDHETVGGETDMPWIRLKEEKICQETTGALLSRLVAMYGASEDPSPPFLFD